MNFPQFTKPIFDAFRNEGHEIYLVGGSVRDYAHYKYLEAEPAICEHPRTDAFVPKDLDFATTATPEQTKKILQKNGWHPVAIGMEFGTIAGWFDGNNIEITTYRCEESYKKGSRKPSVKFGMSLTEDLLRRDFTINAIALDCEGNFTDPLDGIGHLITGLIQTPGEPDTAFSDDPLRMLRAIRFDGDCRFGYLHGVDFEAIKKLKHLIHEVSMERITAEMNRILMLKNAHKALECMEKSGLLGEIFPELQEVVDFKQNQGKWHSKLVWPHTLQVVENTPPILTVRWAALFHDVAKPQTYSETETGVHFYGHEKEGASIWCNVARRLKMPVSFTVKVMSLIHNHLRPSLLSDAPKKRAIRRLIHEVKEDTIDELFALSMADITSHKPEVVAEKQKKCLELKKLVDDVRAEANILQLKLPTGLGIQIIKATGLEGEDLGKLMQRLYQGLIDGDYTLETDFVAEAIKIHKQRLALNELVRITEEYGGYND
jgi:putative nucleotidyltransferase with HDIG domain